MNAVSKRFIQERAELNLTDTTIFTIKTGDFVQNIKNQTKITQNVNLNSNKLIRDCPIEAKRQKCFDSSWDFMSSTESHDHKETRAN